MIVTFCGHSSMPNKPEVTLKMETVLRNLFETNQDLLFYCGGYGEFDSLSASCVESIRKNYANVHCEKIFVTPYITDLVHHFLAQKELGYPSRRLRDLKPLFYCFKRSVDDKAFCVGRGFKFERRCADCFKRISEAVAFLRAYKRVYSRFSDLHIQIFGSPDFQHGVQRVK